MNTAGIRTVLARPIILEFPDQTSAAYVENKTPSTIAIPPK
jgi:hypothetical protein